MASVSSALTKIKNVIIVTEIIGPFHLLAIAPIMDLSSIRKLVNEARNAPNVERVEIACINDTNYPINPSFGKVLSRKSYEIATS